MPVRPNFTPDQVRELRRLGLCDEQVGELRMALIEVSRTLFKRAGRNDVKAVLNDVQKLSTELIRLLGTIAAPPDAARGEALGRIEEGYWQGDRLHDDGPTSMHHVIPRLHALAAAARAGVVALPSAPTRSRNADPRPIARIRDALLFGWVKVHGPRVGTTHGHETLSDMVADAKANPPAPPFPKKLRPSRVGAFSEIAGICYAAAGSEYQPDAAIRNYLFAEKVQRSEMIKGFEQAIKDAKPRRRRIG